VIVWPLRIHRPDRGQTWPERPGSRLSRPGAYSRAAVDANARLPERVVATLEARGERRSVAEGELLYGVDDRQYPFVYTISATLRVRHPDGLDLGVMEPGQFTGELSLLFGQTAFADCIVAKEGEILLVAPQVITELVQVDPEVSDVLLQRGALGHRRPAPRARVERLPGRRHGHVDVGRARLGQSVQRGGVVWVDGLRRAAVRGVGPLPGDVQISHSVLPLALFSRSPPGRS
jgi:hypothetical protein